MNPYRFDRIPLANRALLPDRPGVYAVFNWHGKLLYIGRSSNLRTRWQGKAHHRYPQAKRLLNCRLGYRPCLNTKTIERELIQRYRPIWNNSPVPRDSGNFGRVLHLSLSAIVLAVLATEAPPILEDLRIIWQEREQLIDAVGQWDRLKDRSQE